VYLWSLECSVNLSLYLGSIMYRIVLKSYIINIEYNKLPWIIYSNFKILCVMLIELYIIIAALSGDKIIIWKNKNQIIKYSFSNSLTKLLKKIKI